MLGTVVSLVHVLGNLSAPETLGPAISGAFIATLYGVGSANVVYLPVCYSLQMLSQKEVDERTLVLEGILAIQAGDNPRMVQQKLLSFVAPAERAAVEGGGEAKADLKAVADARRPGRVGSQPWPGTARRRSAATITADHPDERWLVTYADLMTLLVALFMVLFSISSVNKSKFESLQHSLQDAFSGQGSCPAGKSIKESGGTDEHQDAVAAPPESSLQPFVGGKRHVAVQGRRPPGQGRGAAVPEAQAQIDAVAAKQGLVGKIKATVTDEGLLIRLLTDNLLFDSGSATPRPGVAAAAQGDRPRCWAPRPTTS